MNIDRLIDSTSGKNAYVLEESVKDALETFLENVEKESGTDSMSKKYAIRMAATILNTTNLEFFHRQMNELEIPTESA